MRLEIELPNTDEILRQGCHVPIARQNEKWSAACLGSMAKERGVYVIHHAGKIRYIGKTDGPTMDFGTRLRREFQANASGNKHVYPKLSALETPPAIIVCCFQAGDIKKRIKTDGKELSSFQLVGIFEVAMIHHLEPEFQEHHLNAMAKHVQRVITRTTGKELSEENRSMFIAKVKAMIK